MLSDKELNEKRDEEAKDYPGYYELKYMNADTLAQSGGHYLTHGYKAGFDSAIRLMKEREAVLISALELARTQFDGLQLGFKGHGTNINIPFHIEYCERNIHRIDQALNKLKGGVDDCKN